MKLIDNIPYYLVEIRFHDNVIECYDQAAKKILKSIPYPQDITTIRKERSQLYLLLNEKDEVVSEISILISLITKKSELKTEGGYILDLHMDTPSHGYYFGYYEIGEFKLTEDSNLEKIRSYPIPYCTNGRVTQSKHIYIPCREDNKHFLIKLNWKSESPEIMWKKAIPSAATVIELLDNYLFIGFKTGVLQLWDIKKDKCIKEIELFSSPITALLIKGESITIASKAGELARMSKEGDIIWKTNLTQKEIVGIYEEIDFILVVNEMGEQFHVNIASGRPKIHRYTNLNLEGNAGLSSNIINYRNRFVITGYGGIWSFRWENSNNSTHIYMDDPLMRVLNQHIFGFYSGDDDGSVCYWDIGKIEFKVENYSPYLQNYKEYKKLKAKKA